MASAAVWSSNGGSCSSCPGKICDRNKGNVSITSITLTFHLTAQRFYYDIKPTSMTEIDGQVSHYGL